MLYNFVFMWIVKSLAVSFRRACVGVLLYKIRKQRFYVSTEIFFITALKFGGESTLDLVLCKS